MVWVPFYLMISTSQIYLSEYGGKPQMIQTIVYYQYKVPIYNSITIKTVVVYIYMQLICLFVYKQNSIIVLWYARLNPAFVKINMQISNF